jgi:hypothetical protein
LLALNVTIPIPLVKSRLFGVPIWQVNGKLAALAGTLDVIAIGIPKTSAIASAIKNRFPMENLRGDVMARA